MNTQKVFKVDDIPLAVPTGTSYGRFVIKRFARNRVALGAFFGIAVMAIVALGADLIAGNKPYFMRYREKIYFPVFRQYAVDLGLMDWPSELRRRRNLKNLKVDSALYPPIPYGPREIRLDEKYEKPNVKHWFGTDRLGRDVLSGLIHGCRYALVIGLISAGISFIVGLFLGAIAGYFGGWIDLFLSRLFELWASIPAIFLIIAVAAFFPPSLFFIMAIIGLMNWVPIARLTRGQFLQVRSFDYVAAAHSLGCSSWRIILRHILPNAVAPVLIPVAFGVAGAILAESGLSFLGIGVPAEAITWGSILAGARSNTAAWWLVVLPGLAIFATVTMYNLIGDGLRDALDPKMRGN